jgi:hypothetical protein
MKAGLFQRQWHKVVSGRSNDLLRGKREGPLLQAQIPFPSAEPRQGRLPPLFRLAFLRVASVDRLRGLIAQCAAQPLSPGAPN